MNRRGDLTVEAVTLHRRFPYAVLSGWLFLDAQAAHDETEKRRSTFQNTFPRLRLFTGRQDPAGREEQFERLYLRLVDANPFNLTITCYHIADQTQTVDIDLIRASTDSAVGHDQRLPRTERYNFLLDYRKSNVGADF